MDGDTADFEVDLGFRVSMTMRCRLLGIDTPERGQPGYEQSRGALFEMCAGYPLILSTHKDKQEKFGRYLAQIEVQSAQGQTIVPDVSARMIEAGFGVVYEGGGK